MNDNICVCFIVSETTWVRQELVSSSDFPGHSRDVDATILVLCDIRTVPCSISTLRLLSVLRHTTHLVLAVLQTSLGRRPRAGMLCAIVFRGNVDGVGENISGCVRT